MGVGVGVGVGVRRQQHGRGYVLLTSSGGSPPSNASRSCFLTHRADRPRTSAWCAGCGVLRGRQGCECHPWVGARAWMRLAAAFTPLMR